MRPRARRLLWIAPLALVGIALFIFIGGGGVMLLWNWLLPPLFGWPQIGFWQALGLLALCRILFGGLCGGRGPRTGMRERIAERARERMAERWERMTPEEREKYRQSWRARWEERWGPFEPPDSKPTP